MGGRRGVTILSHRPVTSSDLKQDRLFFRETVSTFLQLVVAKRDSAAIILVFKAGAFRYQWAITYSLIVAQPIRTQQNSVLQFTEITMYSFYCKAQQRLKEICVVKQRPREQPHKSHEQYILQKRHVMVDRSIFASYEEAYELFCFPGDFYGKGTQDTEVTKSLHGYYGIEGKFASE